MRDELFDLIRELHEKMDMTVLLVSHSMEDMANYVQRIVVLNHGTLMLDGTPSEVFSHVQELEQVSLAAPQVTYLMKDLEKAGFPVDTTVTTIEEAKKEIIKLCLGYYTWTILSDGISHSPAGSPGETGGDTDVHCVSVSVS